MNTQKNMLKLIDKNLFTILHYFFLTYELVIKVLFQVEQYKALLDEVIIKTEDGTPMLPEMYTVPRDKVQ